VTDIQAVELADWFPSDSTTDEYSITLPPAAMTALKCGAFTILTRAGNPLIDVVLVVHTDSDEQLFVLIQCKHSDSADVTFTSKDVAEWNRQMLASREIGVLTQHHKVVFLYASDRRLSSSERDKISTLCLTNKHLAVMDRAAFKQFVSSDLCFAALSPLVPRVCFMGFIIDDFRDQTSFFVMN